MNDRWLDIEPKAWESLTRRVEAGDRDVLRLFFELRKKWLLNAQETADILGVSEQTVRNWVKAGEIKHVRFGWNKNSALRFDPEDIREFVRSRKLGLGWEVEEDASKPN